MDTDTENLLDAADRVVGKAKWMRESLPYQAPETHRQHWDELERLYTAYYDLRRLVGR